MGEREWKEVKLGDEIKFKNGKKKPKKTGNIPIYGGNGVLGYTNDNNNENVVVIGRVGAYCGSVYYESSKCWVSDNAISAQPLKDNDTKYAYYILKSLRLNERRIGTGQPLLTQGILNNIDIKYPKKEEQKAIAATLSCLDDKIELNNHINKTLEEIAQAIFKSWFVDFEPFQDGEFEDSELGRIPKGWRVESLDNIADFLNGLAMQKYRSKTDDFLPVIKIRELNQGFTDDSSDKASVTIPEQYIINNGDVIFSWSGTLEVKIWTGEKGALNQHLFKVTSKKYEKWFYHLWTLKHLEKFRAIAQDKATTMGHIRRKDLTESKVLIPKDSDMKFLSNILNPIYEKIIKLYLENRTLKEIRDTLLPKLMSGEIRVAIEAVTTNKQG